jgi:hypothetical protein
MIQEPFASVHLGVELRTALGRFSPEKFAYFLHFPLASNNSFR